MIKISQWCNAGIQSSYHMPITTFLLHLVLHIRILQHFEEDRMHFLTQCPGGISMSGKIIFIVLNKYDIIMVQCWGTKFIIHAILTLPLHLLLHTKSGQISNDQNDIAVSQWCNQKFILQVQNYLYTPYISKHCSIVFPCPMPWSLIQVRTSLIMK